MLILVGALVGALGNRIRGGLFPMPGGTQVARVVGWGLPCAGLAWGAGAPWWVALLVGVGAFVGCTFGEHDSQSMGLKGGKSGGEAWGWMTLWGLLRVGPVALTAYVLCARQGVPTWPVAYIMLSGVLCAPIYYAVRWLPDWMLFAKGFGAGTGPGAARDPAEWAELLHGAVMGAALVAAVGGV